MASDHASSKRVSRCEAHKHNALHCLIAVDQLLYCLIGAILSLVNPKIKVHADMTISAKAYLLSQKGTWYGKAMRAIIDGLFYFIEKDHCHQAFLSEKNGNHLPNDVK